MIEYRRGEGWVMKHKQCFDCGHKLKGKECEIGLCADCHERRKTGQPRVKRQSKRHATWRKYGREK